jgi:hypothetical protein
MNISTGKSWQVSNRVPSEHNSRELLLHLQVPRSKVFLGQPNNYQLVRKDFVSWTYDL